MCGRTFRFGVFVFFCLVLRRVKRRGNRVRDGDGGMSVASNLYATPRRQFIHRPFIHSLLSFFRNDKASPVPNRPVSRDEKKIRNEKSERRACRGRGFRQQFFFFIERHERQTQSFGYVILFGRGGGGFRALLVVEEITSWYRVCKCGDGGLIRRGGRKTS